VFSLVSLGNRKLLSDVSAGAPGNHSRHRDRVIPDDFRHLTTEREPVDHLRAAQHGHYRVMEVVKLINRART
jgi:hypothetical protein